MWEYQKKRKIRQILHSWPVLFLMLCLALLGAQAVFGVYKKQQASAEALKSIQGEYARLSDREKALSQSVEFLATHEGQEAEIRKKFRVVREGEHIAVIVDDGVSASSAQAAAAALAAATSTPSWWERMLGFVGLR